MATDFLMLQRYQPVEAVRFRHYEWARPAYSFGMSQRFAYIQSEVQDESCELCRRPTGGGLVSHLEDWTYALVIPATHPASRGDPLESYRNVHAAIAAAITRQGNEVILNLNLPTDPTPGVCFNKAELYDVVLKGMTTKVAGAAQKRTKSGILMQGSIWKSTLGSLDWNRFYTDFVLELCGALDAQVSYESAPRWAEHEEMTLIEQFESEDWNRRR